MRSIRERLAAMDTAPQQTTPRVENGLSIEHVVPGVEQSNHRGPYYLAHATLPDPTSGVIHRHFARCQVLGPGHPAGVTDISRVLFLDTETTGLERGTGTSVFLVGVGYFTEDGFCVQQHFVRDPSEEPGMLHDLLERLSQFSILATFNGRSFDWQMLMNRLILHGFRDIPDLHHWDLMYPTRRIWRHRLQDCSLGSLERNLLGQNRQGDVPGYLIPQLYFDYLRSRDARPLRPVFSHNREDIVSLAKLAELFVHVELDPVQTLIHPVDRFAYALQLLHVGDLDDAAKMLLDAIDDTAIAPELRRRGCRLLATHLKRAGRYVEAIKLWKRMCNEPAPAPEDALYPRVELAKVFEHKFRDHTQALEWTERAINLANIRGWSDYRKDLSHRYARLLRKRQTVASVIYDDQEAAMDQWLGD